jgi:murein DD-endopeptidase MepM/ murein hydrolase activator NlpD
MTAGYILVAISSPVLGQPFQLPTANRAVFESGGEPRFYAGTAGKTWVSGAFGCVRTDGWQMHEGLDIRAIQFDKTGEPTDPVLATADGVVGYINRRPSLSNYGNYLILRHLIEGVEICSLYAHLDEIRSDLKIGQTVRAGEQIGVVGRTSNTRQRITKDRAHLHFELDFIVNDRFASWFKAHRPGERNDHGNWNGANLIALDPRSVFFLQKAQGPRFSLIGFVRSQTELCRVLVRASAFPWLKRYPALVRPNPKAEKEGVVAYEIALNFNGLPFEVIPRAASEVKGAARIQLLSVNEIEYHKNPCRRLVSRSGASWQLTNAGTRLIELLIFD